MSVLYLVDTSAWIFALRRMPVEAIRRRIDELLDLDAVATCGMVLLELLGGTASEHEFARLEMRLKGLHHLQTDDTDWVQAARLAFSLRRTGITVPFTDALVSALALRHGLVLVHADHDFDHIASLSNLEVESLVSQVSS